MKLKKCEIMQQHEFLSLETINEGLNRGCINKYAFILHDKDVDDEGNPKKAHWHIMIQFSDSQDSKYIAKWFKIQEQYVNSSTSGRFNSMLLYLIHSNDNSKYQYSTNEVHANFDYAKFINKQNNELALENVVKLIEDGTIREFNYTNYISPELYIKYKDKIKSAFEFRRDMIYSGNRNLEVIFIQGIPGSGKTTYAKHLAKQLGFSFYVSASDNDLLDGYKSQDCIILDDLRGSSIKLTDLLKLLDNNTDSLTKSRFHNKVLTECKLIIITTVCSLDAFYKSIYESRNEPITQLKRRITTHIVMDNTKVTVTQYNKTTGNYENPCTFMNPVFEILQSSSTPNMRTNDELANFLSLKPLHISSSTINDF